MKQLWILLLLTSTALGANFVAANSGDWQSTTTWASSGTGCHVAYPCITDTYTAGAPVNGDTVSLNGKTVTCSTGETCSFGRSPSTTTLTACTIAGGADLDSTVANGHLIVQNGATFIRGGPICLIGGVTQTIEFQA